MGEGRIRQKHRGEAPCSLLVDGFVHPLVSSVSSSCVRSRAVPELGSSFALGVRWPSQKGQTCGERASARRESLVDHYLARGSAREALIQTGATRAAIPHGSGTSNQDVAAWCNEGAMNICSSFSRRKPAPRRQILKLELRPKFPAFDTKFGPAVPICQSDALTTRRAGAGLRRE